MVCAKSVCVLCTLELIPVASHRFRVHDETTIRSATRDDDDPVSKLAIRFLSDPGWSVEQPFCHLHSEIQQKVHSAVLSGQQILRFRPLSRCPWCRASKTIEKSVFSGQQEVEHVEEHLVIIGCTNNVPAPSLFSYSSEVDTRNGWLLKIFGRTCPSSVKKETFLWTETSKYIFSKCEVQWCVPKVCVCVCVCVCVYFYLN